MFYKIQYQSLTHRETQDYAVWALTVWRAVQPANIMYVPPMTNLYAAQKIPRIQTNHMQSEDGLNMGIWFISMITLSQV